VRHHRAAAPLPGRPAPPERGPLVDDPATRAVVVSSLSSTALAAARGVTFLYRHRIEALEHAGSAVTHSA
jgi:hypothetical protein